MARLAVCLSVVAVLVVAVQVQAESLDPANIIGVTASSNNGTVRNLLNTDPAQGWLTVGNTRTNRDWVGNLPDDGEGWVLGLDNWWRKDTGTYPIQCFQGGYLYNGEFNDPDLSVWRLDGDYAPTLTFKFDDQYAIGGMTIVNYGVGTAGDIAKRGVYKMDIYVQYEENGEFTLFQEDCKLRESFYTNDLGSKSWSVEEEEILFDRVVEIWGARLVIKENQNHACYPDGGNSGIFGDWIPAAGNWDTYVETYNNQNNTYVGLNSVTFNIASVPEPATMSLLALGGLALLRRGRRQY